jgi:NADH dehydrogenase FAD-containing subunit
MNKILILGGGYAGSMAAIRLAHRGFAMTLVDASPGFVERIRLHQVAAGQKVPLVPYEKLFRKLPVRFVRARVAAIDRARKIVMTSDGEIAYDTLVYALGSATNTSVPGVAEHAITLESQPFERLKGAQSVVVVGGGLTGIETAAEVADNARVTIVDGGTIGRSLTAGARQHLLDSFSKHGVEVRENTQVVRVEKGRVVLSDATLEADAIVWCGSFEMSPIAADAGLAVNGRGQIIVDDNLRSSDASIFAAGDAAAVADVRMSCAAALPMGAYVADIIAGETTEEFVFADTVQCISLGRNDGIIQFKAGGFLTGRAAAWVKEFICRYAVASIRLERVGVRYRWPKSLAA